MNLFNQTSLSPENINIVLYCGNKSVLVSSQCQLCRERKTEQNPIFKIKPFLWTQRLPKIRGPCLEAEPVSLLSLCLDRYHHLCHKSPLSVHGSSPNISIPNVFLDGSQHSLVRRALYSRADPPWVCVWRSSWSCTVGTQRKVPPLALPAQFIVIPAPAPACCGFMWPALKQECDFITEIMFVYFCRCPWDLNLKRVLSIIVIKATKHVLGADTKEEFSKHRKALK